jgi:hypothetical protein
MSDEKSGLLWKGRPVEDLSKEELLQALIEICRLYKASLDGQQRYSNFMREVLSRR